MTSSCAFLLTNRDVLPLIEETQPRSLMGIKNLTIAQINLRERQKLNCVINQDVDE